MSSVLTGEDVKVQLQEDRHELPENVESSVNFFLFFVLNLPMIVVVVFSFFFLGCDLLRSFEALLRTDPCIEMNAVR